MSRTPAWKRNLVVELRGRGVSAAVIRRDHGLNPRFINRWWERHLRGEGLADRPRTGRPEKLSRKQKNRLKVLLKRKNRGTGRKATADYNATARAPISEPTVRRVAQSLGLRFRVRTKKPRLEAHHKAARVAFARAHPSEAYWRNVFFSDEKTFGLRYDQRGQWVELNEQPEPRGTEKYGTSVRVWGAVGYLGTSPLYLIPKSMLAQDYQTFLQERVFPDLEEIFGTGWIFQQDGDGSHSAKLVTRWLDEQEEDWISDWPARSPDVSPIENLWAILGQMLVGLRARTVDGLWRRLAQAWEAIPEEQIRELGDSLPARLKLVIAGEGHPIKY